MHKLRDSPTFLSAGPSHSPSDRSLPHISPSHLPHGRGADSELLPTDSAHLMASQMREIMERCNCEWPCVCACVCVCVRALSLPSPPLPFPPVPLNPTNNLVSLSRFFRQARPLAASRKVYMDMVRALRRPTLSHSPSQHQVRVYTHHHHAPQAREVGGNALSTGASPEGWIGLSACI